MAHSRRDVEQLALKILQLLLRDARQSQRVIAKALGIKAASTIGRHIEKMEQNGTITRFTCDLNYERLYEGTMVFAKVKVNQQLVPDPRDFIKKISTLAEVLEVYSVTDSGDYLIKVLAPSNADYGAFIDKVVRTIPGFEHVDSIIILNQLLKRDPEPWRAFPFAE